MKKDKFQPIVMPCTKEQYESLIPVLEEHLHKNNSLIEYRLNGHTIYSMKSITNNHNCKKGFVSFNTLEINDYFHIHKCKRKVYKRFNRKIFLKSLGIVEEPEFVLPEKWTIKRTIKTDVQITDYFKKLHNRQYVYNNPSRYLYHDQKRNIGYSHYMVMPEYTEITFEQFQKYVLKQDQSILESQLVTNKQTEMKSTVNEIKQPENAIKKGLLVVTQERVAIVTKYISDNNFDVTILHPSGQHGLIVTSLNYANIRIFKGKLTLEQ